MREKAIPSYTGRGSLARHLWVFVVGRLQKKESRLDILKPKGVGYWLKTKLNVRKPLG